MNKVSYRGYRFPPEIVHQAIWLYLRFTLSLRDVENLLTERGVAVSYETVRRWVNHFGPRIAADLRKRRLKPQTTCHLDGGVKVTPICRCVARYAHAQSTIYAARARHSANAAVRLCL